MTLMNILKSIITFVVVILAIASGVAQSLEVKWSDESETSRITASELIGRDTAGFYIYRQNRRTDNFFILDYYTYEGYKRLSSVNVELPRVGQRATVLEKIFLIDNHFLVFTSFYDKSNDQNTAYATLLDTRGQVIKPIFEIDRIDQVTSKKNTGNFAFRLSPDSSYVMAFHNTPFRQNQNARFSVKLFDDQLNALWHRKFRLPYSDQDFEVINALADNNQNIFIICRLYGQGMIRINEMTANRHYTLFHYNHKNRKLTEYEINVDNKWIHSARFSLVNDTTLIAGGLYSGSGQGNLAGAFYIRFNTKTGELVNHGFEKLPRDVIQTISYNDDLIFGGLASFELRKMIVRADESAVLVLEKDYVSTTTHFDPYMGHRITTYNYHHDDLMAISMSPEGAMEWATVVPKTQTSSTSADRHASVAIHLSSDQLYLLYNDHSVNVADGREAGETRTISNFNKSVAVAAKINRLGQLSTAPLFIATDFNTILRPAFSNEVYSRRQLIYGEQNGKDKFGEIFYPED